MIITGKFASLLEGRSDLRDIVKGHVGEMVETAILDQYQPTCRALLILDAR